MAGRGGRGRGRGGHMTFNVEAVGIGKGEALPPPTLKPSPLFPPLEYKPLPLLAGEEVEYMLALKQELRGAMKNLPYFIKPSAPKKVFPIIQNICRSCTRGSGPLMVKLNWRFEKDIERYSDKYQMAGPTDNAMEWNPDWKQLPPELKIRVKKTRKQRQMVPVPKQKPKVPADKEEAIKKLETLEKKEEEVTSEEEEEKEEGEEGKEEEEEEYDEEEFEEETDYIMSYFDNGEDFGGDSDDNMDEAIY
ncbi:DNA-directed RNA polymerase III subunit RPC7-like isoform X2 [Ahaetulla prasina]|nr:DNA-directed RNA polymerase III subunit RPC7-like isoform X2 [Ahaetulla prasina]